MRATPEDPWSGLTPAELPSLLVEVRDAWDIQLMPEEEEAGRWRYRRDRTIERPFSEVTWRHESGLLALRPEVPLLYKAKDIRPQDQADFDLVLPTLDPAATDWLAEALRKTAPSCLWLDRLPSVASDGLGAD